MMTKASLVRTFNANAPTHDSALAEPQRSDLQGLPDDRACPPHDSDLLANGELLLTSIQGQGAVHPESRPSSPVDR